MKEFEVEEFKMFFSQLTTKEAFDSSKKKLDYKNFYKMHTLYIKSFKMAKLCGTWHIMPLKRSQIVVSFGDSDYWGFLSNSLLLYFVCYNGNVISQRQYHQACLERLSSRTEFGLQQLTLLTFRMSGWGNYFHQSSKVA